MDLGLSGRTALVCGASSGLGLASAEALAEEGANVVLFARRQDELEAHATRMGALAVVGDVTDDAALESAVATAVDRFGGLDVLVWNGGGPPPGGALDADPDSLDAAYRLLLRSAVTLVRLALPHLERSAGGRILAVSSLAALEPTSHLALSNTFRPALLGWLKTLSREVGPQGITVNCVAPGRIATPRLDHLYPNGPTPEQLDEIALGRWGEPREFGDVVCFLASERARYLTGQTIVVDGGLQKALF
ncbi:MAG: 3-oxoacyl-[acyl-carrier protein] reductase [Gaiellaceae bacterium]|nr:3-oxoacyl-[acyl-carrier protein] reductase [Gaiellaceae bacterium]